MTDEDAFPWKDVNASRRNLRLQQKHPIAEAKQKYLKSASECPKCHTPSDELAWFISRARRQHGQESAALLGGSSFAMAAINKSAFFSKR
jgi:hypothetical protein